MKRFRKSLKWVALNMVVQFLLPVLYPTASYALTSGPSSPEFSSFEPVSTTDNVDLFSGDFTYNVPVVNIPGPDGGGYAMSLSYHSGLSPEQEASWVGFGWTLNPGSISRNKRGFADEFKGATVKTYNKIRPNWTVSTTVEGSLELKSNDKDKSAKKNTNKAPFTLGKVNTIPVSDKEKATKKDAGLTIKGSRTSRYNSYRGFNRTTGFGLDYKGMGGLNMTSGAVGSTFGVNINPMAIISRARNRINRFKVGKYKDAKKHASAQRKDQLEKRIAELEKTPNSIRYLNSIGRIFSSNNLTNNFTTFSVSPYRGVSYNTSSSLQIGIKNIGIQVGYSGNFNAQFTDPEIEMKAYGYMYTPGLSEIEAKDFKYLNIENGGPGLNSQVMMDYTVEKGNSLNKRDRYAGIPFATADQFSVTGEASAGGFNLWKKQIGHFFPTFTKSRQKISALGLELEPSISGITIGIDIGIVGRQVIATSDWKSVDETEFDETERGFFRFNNDQGGQLSYTGSTEAIAAELVHKEDEPGVKAFDLDLSGLNIKSLDSKDERRSSPIEYHNYSEWKVYRFSKDASIISLVDEANKDTPISEESIVEYAITNASGQRSVYGLPVFTKNEGELMVAVDGNEVDDNNFLAHREAYLGSRILDNREVIGKEISEPYANNFLLTEITTYDYIDIADDGPSADDFGGWTKFGYRRWSREDQDATDVDWYRYRFPYHGLKYDVGQTFNPKDDKGSVSYGEKQIYHLGKVETKTHIAYFVTNKTKSSDFDNVNTTSQEYLNGKLVDRFDALGALDENGGVDLMANLEPEDSDYDAELEANDQKLEYLEKIVVFAKDRPGKPLQTVHFDYEYSLNGGVPNSYNTEITDQEVNNENETRRTGKLTLTKVWFESEGVVRSRIAPYKFEYNYPTAPYPNAISSVYPDIEALRSKYAGSSENPDYAPEELDMWGNYQVDGSKRNALQRPWVYQGNDDDLIEKFSPAAWHLKQVKLPSGGEIHVQYEQKDYAYVQDKDALAMVSLENTMTNAFHDDYQRNNYIINLEDVGLKGASDDELTNYKNKLEKYFIGIDGPKNYIYFKYFFRLDQGTSIPEVNELSSQYITGYVSVQAINLDLISKSIEVVLGDHDDWKRKNTLNAQNFKTLPRQVADEYYVTSAQGLVPTDNWRDSRPLVNVDRYESTMLEIAGDLGKIKDVVVPLRNIWEQLDFKTGTARSAISANTQHVFDFTENKGKRCKVLNPQLSYLRLPVPKNKRGGGTRVKRLLMFDKGLEASGNEHLFGSEYHYVLEDGRTSGVATNEPQEGKEENALVGLLDRGNQSFLSRAIAGVDREQFEGPLGENILPAPSVGHSRIVINNIHKGKSGSAYQVHNFYTCKDSPYTFKENHTEFYKEPKNRGKDWMELPLGIVNISVRRSWYTQGYSFIKNKMHGAAKSVETFTYTDRLPIAAENRLVGSTSYEYYGVGEDVNVLDYDAETKKFSIERYVPGAEESVSMESRRVYDETLDLNLEIDLEVSWASPFQVAPSFTGSFSSTQRELSTHVMSKVWSYPAILKSTTSYVDNVESVTENLYFDKNTGKPVVTVVYDGYHGLKLSGQSGEHKGGLYSYSVPAAWIYGGMGQKANDPTNANLLSASAMGFTTYGKDIFEDAIEGTSLVEVGNRKGIRYLDVTQSLQNIVMSGSATTYKQDWAPDASISAEYNSTGVSSELNEFWRPHESYVYNSDVKNTHQENPDGSLANASDKYIYNSGMIKSFKVFDFEELTNNDNTDWLKVSEVTKYSPNGVPLEERDVLGIMSSARYGYQGKILPTIAAKNASYETIFFKDFETESTGTTQSEAHSGFSALNFSSNTTYSFVGETDGLKLNEQLNKKGAVVKVWCKSKLSTGEIGANSSHNMTLKVNGESLTVLFEEVASSGEWTLYQARIKGGEWTGVGIGDKLTITIDYNFLGNESVYIDDFRFQPYDAEVMCYVYDKFSLRPLAEFGDQHFGVFYQYNNEGQLVRKSIETEKGRRTLQETQYNVPREGR